MVCRKSLAMSVLLLSFLGASVGSHCPIWKEIAPCTCWTETSQQTTIYCEKMQSFDQVTNILQGKFVPTDKVTLWLKNSDLQDLPYRRFKELNMTIVNLKLTYDNLHNLEPSTFDGLQHSVTYLSLADNIIGEVPEHLWRKLPSIKTLDLGRTKIRELTESNFKDLPQLETLVVPGNLINRIDSNAIPPQIRRLHIGRNNISDLNGTLTRLTDLNWLFVNMNHLTTLDDQLPYMAPHLKMMHVSQNLLRNLPQQLRNLPTLESFFVQYNQITSLDGTLAKSRELKRCVLEYNNIQTLTPEDFTETILLESLHLGHNEITSLNNSLLNLRNLKFLNMTDNLLTHFSFQDIMGLTKLQILDLSHNNIRTVTGPAANLVDWNIKLTELKLDHNEIESLNGALSGLPILLRLNLSHNKLRKISPDDFIGLDQLRLLDVSYNYLTTLEETSTTFLPRLEELRASNNFLTILDKDFHGLPVLCHADLSHNQIVALGRDLVSKTRCKIGQGVHEGAWDTLKLNLEGNPIICDAAFPEISSAMEINHTRIYGITHCPPLSEQPVTSKPNGFLGYIPEPTSPTPQLPAAIAASQVNVINTQNTQPIEIKPLNDDSNQNLAEGSNNLQIYPVKNQNDLRRNEQYQIESNEPVLEVGSRTVRRDEPIAMNFESNNQKPNTDTESIDNESRQINDNGSVKQNLEVQSQIVQYVDPIKQEQKLTQLASEIEELRTKIEVLAEQNQLLLSHQLQNNTGIVLDNGQNGIKILENPIISQKEDPKKP